MNLQTKRLSLSLVIGLLTSSVACQKASFGQNQVAQRQILSSSVALVTNGTLALPRPETGAPSNSDQCNNPNECADPDSSPMTYEPLEMPPILIGSLYFEGKFLCYSGPDFGIKKMLNVTSLANVPLCENIKLPDGFVSVVITAVPW